MEGQALNANHIVQALTAINTPGVTSENIKIANDFLAQCEKNPAFATILLTIYSEQQNYQLQVGLLALLTNVIKRNWSSKRLARNSSGVAISPEHKQQLRKNILEAYMLHDSRNYKHFNNLIGYLARLEYPNSYPGLHSFIINSLNQLLEVVKNDLETVLSNNRVLAVLSTCKTIMKEYSLKKITHNEEAFLQYVSEIIQLGITLSHQLIVKVKASFDVGAKQASVTLLQCLRKIDKVVLYGLGSITSIYQYKPEVKMIINSYVQRVEQFNNLYGQIVYSSLDKICQQFQKYFIGIIELLGKLQNYFPFAFSDVLKQYLYLLLTLLVKNVPDPKYYKSEKLLSVIITANFKPLNCFAYYMTTQQFTSSIYCRKRSQVDNVALQNQCNEVFRSTYNTQSVNQLLNTFITSTMTASHILQDHKEFNDDLILQDCQIAIVDQPNETSVYQNCLTFVKNLIKCRKVESRQVVIAMIHKVQELKDYKDSYNQQILSNILQVVLVLPYVYEIEALPIDQICEVISSVYEAQKFNYLARIIRKFHSFLPLQTVKICFEILAQVVATPISGSITPQIIYQSALALKTLMSQMDTENIPVTVLANCISNIVSLVNLKQFIACPTLLWPIVNLIIKLVKSLYDINRQLVSDAGQIIIRGLYSLISSEKNQEMLVSAISELMSTLLFCCFKAVKLSYHIRGASFTPNERLQNLNKSSFIVFEAAIIFMKSNIRNRALQNYDTIYRFWLALIRSYPTVYEQQIYEFQLNQMNSKLIQFFNSNSSQLMDDDPVVFTEILEEYVITELISLNDSQLKQLILTNLSSFDEYTEQRSRITMATASLYFSYSILRGPIQQLVIIYFKELIKLELKVSSQANCVRTMLLLIVQHYILHHSAVDAYQMFTMACEGNFVKWFLPYLWSMHYVSNKFALYNYLQLLNTAGIMKAISDIGPQNYSQLLMNSNNNQLAMDEFLKVISIELNETKLQFAINSYHNVYKGVVPNQLAPQFQVLIFRKTHLHFSDPILRQLIETNLSSELGSKLRDVFACLDWTSADLEQRIGEKAALDFCTLLGWERKIC